MRFPRTAALEVYLENPTQEAKVFIDEKYLDTTPLSRSIPVCSKKIRVEKFMVFSNRNSTFENQK